MGAKELINDLKAYDLIYFRGKYCGCCARKECDRSDKEVDSCVSDEMIRQADEVERYGE